MHLWELSCAWQKRISRDKVVHRNGLGSLSLNRIAAVLLFVFVISSAVPVFSQDFMQQTGVPEYMDKLPVELGFINVSNGNLHLEIPIASYPQRGKRSLTAALVYDSRMWRRVTDKNGTTWWKANAADPFLNTQVWRYVTSADPARYSSTPVPRFA